MLKKKQGTAEIFTVKLMNTFLQDQDLRELAYMPEQ